MAARARTARAKARREARKTQRQRGAACVRRTPLYMRDDGRVDAEVRAEIGKKMVGMQTPHWKVLEYLDFYRLCRVARVCKDWKILAGVMRKAPEQQFRAKDRTCSFLAKTLSGAALPFKGISEVQCHADPVTNRLCQLYQSESGAEVVDPSGAGVAGFVTFVDNLAEAGATGRGLICAQPEEMAKWREAFRDKPYLRKASFFSGGIVCHYHQRLQVGICSRKDLFRHWARFFRMTWRFFVIDDGSAQPPPHSFGEEKRILTLAMNRGFATATTCYHFCQSLTTDIGLDEAAYRNQFVKSVELAPLQELRKLSWIGNSKLLKPGAERHVRCTAEFLRRDLCAHLKSTCRIDVEKVVARHQRRLSQRLCMYCGRQDGVDRKAFEVCGACGEASYCSRSCQIQAWAEDHSETCTQRRRKLSERYCSYCYKYGDIAEEPFSLCGGCDERRYCSTNCAYVDWHFGRGDGAHHLTCPGAKAASDSRENAMAKWRERNQRLSRLRCGVVNW